MALAAGAVLVLALPPYSILPFALIAFAGLCCTNTVRDSSCESSVIAGGHEQTELTDLQDAELARV
jgi:apolipoprotein N-acyltransferase